MGWFALILLLVGVYVFLKIRRKRIALSFMPEQFVVIDIETTGLDPDKHENIEIDAVKFNRGSNQLDAFQVLVKPNKEIPKKITGITQEMIKKEGVALESAIPDLISFIGDLRLVAFNADFDMAFLQNAAKGFGTTIRNPIPCALKTAKQAWPGRKNYRLGELAKAGGLSTKGAHRALHDCKLTIHVYAQRLQSFVRLTRNTERNLLLLCTCGSLDQFF